MSHIDPWDPKPDAVAKHRSPHKTISTSNAGIQLTELLPRNAQHTDKLSILRNICQPEPGIGNSHPKGSQYF